jgi:hypothetical protein
MEGLGTDEDTVFRVLNSLRGNDAAIRNMEIANLLPYIDSKGISIGTAAVERSDEYRTLVAFLIRNAILVLMFFTYGLLFQKQPPKKIDKKMHTEKFKGTPLLIQTINENVEVGFNESPQIFIIKSSSKNFKQLTEKLKDAVKNKKQIKVIVDKNEIIE